jgi:hypothetical protein
MKILDTFAPVSSSKKQKLYNCKEAAIAYGQFILRIK